MGCGGGDGRLGFLRGFGRFEARIHDQVEDVGGPDPAGFTLKDGLAKAVAVDDAAWEIINNQNRIVN